MLHFDYILIGQGISGSVLALEMQRRGLSFAVINAPAKSASSQIAAGVVNPIVLKRLKLVQEAEHYMSRAQPFYRKAETQLMSDFVHPQPIWHIFHRVSEQNQWLEKSAHPAYAPYLSDAFVRNSYSALKAPHGFGLVEGSFWLDSASFLQAVAQHLGDDLFPTFLEPEQLDWAEKRLVLNGQTLSFKRLIDCGGHLSRLLHPQLAQAFRPTRGEVLLIETEAELPQDAVLHAGVFILPLGDRRYKVGASYHWDLLEDQSTEGGKAWLVGELDKILDAPYRIVEHLAGVRPNTADRKPLVGELAKNFYCFNGMGSRAVLMAPALAEMLCEQLTEGTALPEHLSPLRFT